jgi:hypothetical protein
MNGTGRKSANSSYLVILLLIVALTAFSHSMKELTEMAQWSGNFAPAEAPVVVVKFEKTESCDSSKHDFKVRIPDVQ